jgi:hypothetical protein
VIEVHGVIVPLQVRVDAFQVQPPFTQ